MKQKNQATLLVIISLVVLILLVVIGLVSFFIITELKGQNIVATEEPSDLAPDIIEPDDNNYDNVPDEIERILNLDQMPPLAAPNGTNTDLHTDNNRDGVPDAVERIIQPNAGATGNSTPTLPVLPPPAPSSDKNNNNVPDEIEKIIGPI